MEIPLYTCSNLKLYLYLYPHTYNPVQIAIKIESTLKYGLILLKKNLAKGTIRRFNPALCFVNASIILNTSRKEPRPNSNHSVCNYHLLEKNKKRTRTLCSSCVTGSYTGRKKSASNLCVSSFSYECCVLPFPCPMKWGGTAGLTSLRANQVVQH